MATLNYRAYTGVHGFFMSWEDQDANSPITQQLCDLKEAFEDCYGFNIQHYRIPVEKCYRAVDRRLASFVDANDGEGKLLIFYYRGHAATADHELFSFKLRDGDLDEVPWDVVKNKLTVQVDADVLIILDCCYASAAATLSKADSRRQSGGSVMLIASSAVAEESTMSGDHTFTKNLIEELRESHMAPIDISELFNNLRRRCISLKHINRNRESFIKIPFLHNISPKVPKLIWLFKTTDDPAARGQPPRAPRPHCSPPGPTPGYSGSVVHPSGSFQVERGRRPERWQKSTAPPSTTPWPSESVAYHPRYHSTRDHRDR
ncbi:Peptidase S8 [Cordyceps militaris]|uniref:Peptidase S8 n=1 Tax=Cordyceps militaris TaxID=73501 RepID=A0A2H4SQM1_CORMI|nr:Peptidase S8 [Cordyceps militaris]